MILDDDDCFMPSLSKALSPTCLHGCSSILLFLFFVFTLRISIVEGII